MEIQSANFRFLHQHDPQLGKLAALAEQFFHSDSNTCIIKLRQYAERLAKIIAANTGLYQSSDEAQAELLKRLKLESIISSEVADLFHAIRIAGNKAVHNSRNTDSREALTLLKNARQLGIWFHRTFKDRNFKAGAFVPPVAPIDAAAELQAEIVRLQAIAFDSQSAADRSRLEIEQKAIALMSAEEKARQALEERQLWEQIAIETEQKLAQQITNQRVTPQQTADILKRSQIAAQNIDLDEDQTRQIIDQKLRDRGWEVDSVNLRYSQGFRPIKGKNIAISEYPTNDGIADYALFIGLRCVAMIEAKRRRKNVMDAIGQAERYARGYNPHPPAPSPIKGEGEQSQSPSPSLGEGFRVRAEVQVPFVFATNGRGYLKQLETESGIWFRDRRKSTNHSRALVDFYTPEGLEALLAMDREDAHEKLKNASFNFGFDLYPHQRAAIEKIEEALEKDRRSMLVAMATGTGKTKLAIALLYRLLSARRFRRVCFVVDRSALGNQTADEFTSTKVVTTKTFADIFGIKGLKDIDPESETKVHICTIQGLVKRILYAKENGDIPPIDQYDLILIDECHRGYLLDREMSDSELSFRNQEDYISKYRRVLEHFDAVKIGLTATPALHTKQIFGDPIYKYSYREAVIDGRLIDHEPPFQIGTLRNKSGIKFKENEQLSRYNTLTGEINLSNTPDELNFDVVKFNKQVITEPFNRAIAHSHQTLSVSS
jgi:type I restriction enzyme R subunit